MKKIKPKKQRTDTLCDYRFGQPRIEMTDSECLIDGLGSVLEYTEQKIKVLVGSQVITFYGDDLHINSFTHEGAIVEGAIISIEFSSRAV